MTSTIISVLLLLTFAGFIYYIIKGGNLMIGFFIMAILWSVIGMVPFNTAIQKVFAEPALNYGPTIIYIVFGSWFGRVLVDSGIAPAISETTNKVGKKTAVDRRNPGNLCHHTDFVSAYGVGSVIAIGVILLPILLSVGMPRDLALSVFALSIGAPMYINVVLFNQIKAFFPKAIYGGKYLEFGIVATLIQVVAIIVFLILHRKKINPANAEKNLEIIGAVDADQAQIKSVPKLHLLFQLCLCS